jgi:hypothetical protein
VAQKPASTGSPSRRWPTATRSSCCAARRPTASPKTIEYHLSQIYRKLDLRSRTQLASLMAQEMESSRTA